jgi:arylsulfatase A-like enzyme
VATILTGQPPHVHQASRAAKGLHKVAPSVPTLAEQFATAGFRTGAVVNVVFCSPESGLSRGFERYDYVRSDKSNTGSRDAKATTDAALAWLDGVGKDPYFLVVHYFDAHLTYDPPPPFDTMFELDGTSAIEPGFGNSDQVRAITDGTLQLTDRQKQSLEARYDGEIRFLDEQFGRLRRGLEERGLSQRTTVLVVGDHGEEFWDHGSFEHGHTHYHELINVPLILRRPGAPGGVVRSERVRQIDIAPTLLAQSGLAVPPELPGQVLGRGSAALAIAEGSLWAGDLRSSRTDRGTTIWNHDTGAWQFYGPDDPRELTNLWPSGPPAEVGDEVRLLQALPPSRREEPGEWEPTEGQMEALRSLGYAR